MPIVFVHGVNNRDSAAYRENELGRNGLLREIVGPALGLSPDAPIYSPYWGEHGAKFAWNMSVIPNPDDTAETFGGIGVDGAEGAAIGRVAGLMASSPIMSGNIVADAKQNFPEAVDTLYAAAIAGVTSEQQARHLARSYMLSAAYAVATPNPPWVETASEGNFVDQLEDAANVTEEEAFGAGGIIDSLKEGMSRLANALPGLASNGAGRLLRKKLNSEVTRFAGDAFTYLAQRGTKQAPGPIVATVMDSLTKANAEREPGDDQLIVIAHSFGGEIVYDILTHFATQFQVDCLVTVGSQVGLFEEMKLYLASKAELPPDPPQGRVAMPTNLSRWINVYDTNDVLSYRLEPVVAGVVDFFYDTGYSMLGSHGGYFLRPSFYTRLAERLKQD